MDLFKRPKYRVQDKPRRVLTGWVEFVRGFHIDKLPSRAQKRQEFMQVMRFRRQTLGQ